MRTIAESIRLFDCHTSASWIEEEYPVVPRRENNIFSSHSNLHMTWLEVRSRSTSSASST